MRNLYANIALPECACPYIHNRAMLCYTGPRIRETKKGHLWYSSNGPVSYLAVQHSCKIGLVKCKVEEWKLETVMSLEMPVGRAVTNCLVLSF